MYHYAWILIITTVNKYIVCMNEMLEQSSFFPSNIFRAICVYVKIISIIEYWIASNTNASIQKRDKMSVQFEAMFIITEGVTTLCYFTLALHLGRFNIFSLFRISCLTFYRRKHVISNDFKLRMDCLLVEDFVIGWTINKISYCRNNSKIEYQFLRKRRNRYRHYTNTWSLTFHTWFRHFNKTWRG
jgi:hypothetical protein